MICIQPARRTGDVAHLRRRPGREPSFPSNTFSSSIARLASRGGDPLNPLLSPRLAVNRLNIMTIKSASVKTGQHPPLYDLLRPYEDFPKRIDGPSVWRAEDLRERQDSWTYGFSEEQIRELGEAADSALASGRGLTGITKVRATT